MESGEIRIFRHGIASGALTAAIAPSSISSVFVGNFARRFCANVSSVELQERIHQ
jgi:hypothetical protein